MSLRFNLSLGLIGVHDYVQFEIPMSKTFRVTFRVVIHIPNIQKMPYDLEKQSKVTEVQT